MKLVKLVSISIAILFIQGCSHPLEIEGEGDVTSATGDRGCTLEESQLGDPVCAVNLVVYGYQETYYAEPREGWVFDHWGNYCLEATVNSCSFNSCDHLACSWENACLRSENPATRPNAVPTRPNRPPAAASIES